MKSSRPASAQCRSSKTMTTGRRRRRCARRRCATPRRAASRPRPPRLEPEQRQQRRLDPAPLGLVGHVARRPSPATLARVVASSSVSTRPARAADHLAERPEGDALAVGRASGRRASRPSPTTPSRYFANSQARRLLPMPAWPDDRHQPGATLAAVAWKRSLSRRSSSSRPTNGASSASARFRPPRSATTRSARQAGTGAALPLSVCSPAGSKAMARLRGPLRSPRRPARCRAPPPTAAGLAVLTRSPATMPWLVAPSVTAASPVRTPARAWIAGAQRRGPRRRARAPARTARSASSSWAIGRAPDGHDGVADELLDRAAVALDDVAGELEVARQQLARRPRRRAPRRTCVKPTRSANRTRHEAALASCRRGGLRSAPDVAPARPRPWAPHPPARRGPRAAASRTRCRTWRSGCWPSRRPGRRSPAVRRTPCRTWPRGGSLFRSSDRSMRSVLPIRPSYHRESVLKAVSLGRAAPGA